jgi:hypothetical protein
MRPFRPQRESMLHDIPSDLPSRMRGGDLDSEDLQNRRTRLN